LVDKIEATSDCDCIVFGGLRDGINDGINEELLALFDAIVVRRHAALPSAAAPVGYYLVRDERYTTLNGTYQYDGVHATFDAAVAACAKQHSHIDYYDGAHWRRAVRTPIATEDT